MISRFTQYLVEEQREIFFSFGRMNPPTVGHEKLIERLAKNAGSNAYRVYLSQSYDPKQNPLQYKEKVKTVRRMFPRHARGVILNNKLKTVLEVAVSLYNEGHKRVTMVVGSDRVIEFKTLLEKYNGKKVRHGFYNFESINIVSAGQRDPDAEGVAGMSASKMRESASNNDFRTFTQGLPKSFSNKNSKDLFNTVRKGMNLKPVKEWKYHVELDTISEDRELYVAGILYKQGDQVIIKENNEVVEIVSRGPNYLVVETDGKKKRVWLDAVEPHILHDNPREAIDPAVLGDYGTDASVKKMKKMTPGQNGLMKFEAGTVVDYAKENVAIAKAQIGQEKRKDAYKHDKMMDRARLKAVLQKNRMTKVRVK
jgi:nicotinamide mononucleotide adenylyltransferase